MHSALLSFGLALLARQVLAETHTITFENKCGFGTPQLVQDGKIVSTGESFTANGPFDSAIAYLNSTEKPCLLNGEGCMLFEMNMANPNPSVIGSGPSVDISLITPHTFNFPGGFQFYGADGSCDGLGAFCSSDNCDTAFFGPNDNQVQRACIKNNVNLVITFCGDQNTAFTNAVTNSLADLDSGSPAAIASPAKASPQPSTSKVLSVASTTVAAASTISHLATPVAPINVESAPPVAGSSSSSTSASAASAPVSSPAQQCRRRSRRSAAPAPAPTPETVQVRAANARSHRRRVRARAFHH